MHSLPRLLRPSPKAALTPRKLHIESHLTHSCASRIRGWKMMFRASKVRGLPYENHIVLPKNDSLIWKRFEVSSSRAFRSTVYLVNPLNSKSNHHLNSPYNITSESHIKVMQKLRRKGLTVISLLPPYWRCGYRRKWYPYRKGSSIPAVCNFWRIIDNVIILDEKRAKFHEFRFCDKLFTSRLPN